MAGGVPRSDVAAGANQPKTKSGRSNEQQMNKTTRVDAAVLPVERWDDPSRGAITWQTLISAGTTATQGLICGIASLKPGDDLALHQHTEPEIYIGVAGECDVVVDGVSHQLGPEIVLFIAGNALHGIKAVDQPVRFFYCFARDGFDQIAYRFPKDFE